MSDPIRILVVEDRDTDFELAQREIRRSVKGCKFRLVKTREEFLDALGSFKPDLILSDFSLPNFDGMKALKLTLEHAPLTPFIIWTGSMGEDTAVECMKAGAVNYIIKENLKRLGPAVVHALEERQQLVGRKQAELRYEAIFEQSHDAIFILDLEGRILTVNRRAADMLGYPREELLGLSVKDITAEEKQSAEILKRLVAGELVPAYERLFRRKDGSLVPVEVNVELVYDARGKPSHIQSIVRDITDRKRDEIELRRRNEHLGLLNAINEAVVRGASIDTIVDLLAGEMKRIFSATGTSVYMLTPDGKSITLRQYRTSPAVLQRIEGVIGSTVPLIQIPIREGGYFQKALASSGGMILSDPAEIQSWMEEFTETNFLPAAAKGVVRKLIPQIYKVLNIKSVVVVPLVSNGRTIGLLDISSPGHFTENELERIGNISRQLTAAIQRQQANERVQRSEEFLQSVQNALSASIAILDEKGTIVRVNSAWRRFGEIGGFKHPDHGIGLNYLEICDSVRGEAEEEAQAVAAAIREVIFGKREDARFEYAGHSPVEKRWFVLRITKFEDMDRTWVVVAHENITDRKQAEQALFESEKRYHGLFENSPVAIWEEDFSDLKKHIDSLRQQGVQDFRSYFQSRPEELAACAGMIKVNDVNKAALKLYEADSKETLIEETIRVLTQGEQEHNLEDFVAIAEDMTSNSWEGADKTLTGRPIEINLTWSVAPGYEHDYSKVIVTTVDVTERKRADQALHESEARYRGLFENTPIAIWEEDFSEVKKYLDSLKQSGVADFRAYFASHPGEMIRCKKMVRIVDVNKAALEMYETDDKQELIRVAMEDFSEGELENLLGDLIAVAEGNTSHGWEGADETLTGRPIQINLKRSVVPGHEHDYSRVIVTTVDVTERNRAEKSLKSREAIISAVAYSAQQLIDAGNWEEVVPGILKRLGQATNVSRVYTFQNQISPEGILLTNQRFEWTAPGTDPQIENPDLQHVPFIEAGFSRWAGLLGSNQAVFGNVHEFPVDEQEILSPQNIRSIVVVPVFAGEKWWGFIGFDDCLTERSWDATEINALKTAAGNLGSAIQRYEAEEALRVGEERFRGLFENSPVGLLEEDFSEVRKYLGVLKQSGVEDFREYFASNPEEVTRCNRMIRVLNVNETAVQMFEADSKETLLEFTNNYTSQGEQEHNHEDFVAIAEGRTSNSWEGEDTKLTGVPLEVSLSWSVVPGHEEDYSRVIVTTMDITERRQAERDRLERLKEMTCLYAVRHDMGLELSIHELCQRIVEHLTHAMQFPELAVPVIELDGRRYSTDKYNEDLSHCLSVDVEVRGKTQGSLRVYYLDDKPFILPEEQDLIKSIADDLRLWLERRQAEESLRESEERYRSLFDRMLDGVYRSTHKGRFVEINPAMVRMFGYSSREEMLELDIKNELYFSPEERGSHLLDTGQEEVDVYRMRRKDGSEIWVEDRGSYVHDEAGNIVYHEGILRDVTERKRVEEALREAEIKYRNLVERLPVIVYTAEMGENGRWTYIGPQIETVLGFTPDEWMADDSLWYRQMNPEDRDRHQKAEEQAWIKGNAFDAEYRLRRKDGREIWMRDVGVIFPSPEGGAPIVQGTLMDVTDRKRVENELRRANSLLNATLEATKDGILVVGRDRSISSFNRKFLEIWKVPYSLMKRWDDHTLQEFIRSQLKDPDAYTAAAVGLYQSPKIDSFDGLELQDGRIVEWHSQPQRLGKEIVGRVWSFRDVTERKRAEQELRTSEERFRQLADNIKEMFWMTDVVNEREEYVSPAFEEIWGFPSERLMEGKVAFLDTVLEEDLAAVTSMLEKQMRGEQTEIEYRITRSDGSVRWIWDRAFPIFDDDGKVLRVAGIAADVTERKRAQEELRESEQKIQNIIQHSTSMFYSHTADHLLKFVSPQSRQILDCEPEEAMRRWQEWLSDHPANQEGIESTDRAILTGKRQPPYELELITKKKRRIWVRVDESPVVEDGKTVAIVGSITDITERKALERERQLLTSSISASLNEVYLFHADTLKFIFVNNGALKNLGYTQEEVLQLTPLDLKTEMTYESFQQLIAPLVRHDKPLQVFETKHRRSDGSMYPVDVHLQLFENDDQRVFLAVIQDITERKQAEEQLRKLSRAVEQSASTILITDRAGNIEYVNPRFTETTGYTSEEAVGQNPRILQSGQTPLEEYEQMWKTITSGEDWQGEFLNKKKNGELYWEFATVSPILNERGETTHFIAVKEDVTDRKRSERDIRRHLAELEALYENGLAVGQLLEPREIGERIINTFSRHLPWHHVAVRLLKSGSDDLELIAFSLPHKSEEGDDPETALTRQVTKVSQGISGWVVQTGEAVRTGNVHEYPQYVDTYKGILSGLYMPLKVGDRVLGVISVESEEPDAFTVQDERLLATLANQAAVAFENARLYQSIQQELAERRRAQEALYASETHYRELADSITDIFFELDQNLHFTHWNRTSEILTGVTAKDAIGKSMADVFGASRELTRVREIYSRVLSTRRPKTFETVFTLNREIRSFEINAYPSTRGVSVVAKDVTNRKRSETIMQKRFELMEFSAHHSLEEIARKIMDEIGELTGSRIGFLHFMAEDEKTIDMQVWSTTSSTLFESLSEEEKHLPVDQAGVWAEAVRQRRPLIHNDYPSLSDRKGLPPGHAEIARQMLIPVIRNEKIVAVMGVANKLREYTQPDLEIAMQFADHAWDITERKQMEVALAGERNLLAQRVEERTAELRASNANLARALRVKDEFLANMSHELRTPLNAVLGLSESLSEQVAGPLNEKQIRYVTTISESGHHLLSLINDILDLAKIEAGQVKLDINKVDVNSVCEASLRLVRQMAQKKKQEIVLDIASDLGLIWADERRLKQMIVNLLSNAVKFTSENGRIGLEVGGGAADNKVMFTVWDNGIGIKEADLARLFQPFMQLDAGLARESSGTGLGLALVAQMARLHGGGVKVDSIPGQGSRFTIVLPWQPAVPMSSGEKLRQTGKLGPSETDAKKMAKILLIEDTREVVMMIQDYLEMEGYTVVTAQDGLDGLAQAKLTHPDLILMDLQMPRMDGLEATRRLRSEPGMKHIPIIAVTALAMPNDRERCLAAGMNEYITKPVNLKALVKTIQKSLSTAEEKTESL